MTEKKTAETAITTTTHNYPALCNPGVGDMVVQAVTQMGLTPWQFPKISVPSGGGLAWTIDKGDGPEPAKDFVGVIGLIKPKQRAWYTEAFGDSGGGTPPSCSSSDGVHGFGVNALNAPTDAGSVHNCATCEWNQFGSKRGGKGNGKDCEEAMHLYVWLEGEALPTIIKVPPTSLQAVQTYALSLMSKMLSPSSVMTRFALKTRSGKGVPDCSQITLTIDRKLSEEEIANTTALAHKMESLVPTLYPAVVSDSV